MAQLLRPAFVSSNAQLRPAWLESVPVGPTILARTLQVINLQTGQVLYSKGTAADDNEPASLTKLMTTYVLSQQKPTLAALAQTTVITAADVLDGASQLVQAGDVVSLYDLMVLALLPSDNASTSAIARTIGLELLGGTGTEEQAKSRFYTEMNTQAGLLGMTDTTYTSAHGLSGASSCPDTNALLAQLARNAVVRDIWRHKQRNVTLTRGGVVTPISISTSVLIDGEVGIIGGKTGTLNRENLALLWEAPNGQLIALTLIGSQLGGGRYTDMAAVMAALPVDYPALATPSVPFTPAYLFDTLGFAGGWWDGSGIANKWQDAAGTTAVTATAQPLGKWTPRSGTGTLAFAQGTAVARPLYQGGATGVQFDGTDDYLDLGAGSFGAASLFADSGQKYMVVQKFAVTGTSGTVIAKAGAVTTGRTFQSYTDQAAGEEPAAWVRGAQTLIDKNIVNGASHAVDLWWDGSQGGMSTDQTGTLGLLIGTAGQETQNITLGASTGGTANFLTGSVQQIVLTDRYDIDAFRRLRDWSNGGTVNAFGYSAGYADGGGTPGASAVSSNIAQSYQASASLSADAAQTYIAQTQVASDSSQSYPALQSLSADGMQTYGAMAYASADSTQAYTAFQLVSQDTAQSYIGLAQVSADSAQTYSALMTGSTSVSSDSVQSYVAIGRVSADNAQNYTANTYLDVDSVQGYIALARMVSDAPQSYSTFQWAIRDSSQTYTAGGQVSVDQPQTYTAFTVGLMSVSSDCAQVYGAIGIVSAIPSTGVRNPFGRDRVGITRTYGGRHQIYSTNRRHTY